jgi:hypothetical protein
VRHGKGIWRLGRMGPVFVSDVVLESDPAVDGGETCGSYRVLVAAAHTARSGETPRNALRRGVRRYRGGQSPIDIGTVAC